MLHAPRGSQAAGGPTEAFNEEAKAAALKKFPPIPLGGFGVYARRLNAHRLVLFFVPKNAKTVRLLMPHCTSSFPIFVYYVDKLLMARRFVEATNIGGGGTSRRVRTIVEDFTQKARTSTLAHLNAQLHDHLVAECFRRAPADDDGGGEANDEDDDDDDESPLDEFYLRGLESTLRAPLETTRFQVSVFIHFLFEHFQLEKSAFICHSDNNPFACSLLKKLANCAPATNRPILSLKKRSFYFVCVCS